MYGVKITATIHDSSSEMPTTWNSENTYSPAPDFANRIRLEVLSCTTAEPVPLKKSRWSVPNVLRLIHASNENVSPTSVFTSMFTAKISPRKGRVGLPAPLAARDACLGPNGRPDEVGGATIKALGIYPPGSYVKLASGEVAVVMRRGARADRPRVGSIVSREGQVMGVPALRDTTDPRHEVKGAVRTNEIRVRVNHERMPVLLSGEDQFETWLSGPVEEAFALARSFDPGAMHVSRCLERPSSKRGLAVSR